MTPPNEFTAFVASLPKPVRYTEINLPYKL